ncbi:conserved hypothetical protein [Trichinella spiralis]|uniref:hypothetical protein n=1 Tax=Trichinella spiralis TaxID=6334 RepID=UPI0001EFCEE3|nr:conserved hypothetical protein [Trichinella spiralis]
MSPIYRTSAHDENECNKTPAQKPTETQSNMIKIKKRLSEFEGVVKLAASAFLPFSFHGKPFELMGSCFVNADYSVSHVRLRIIVAKGYCPDSPGMKWFEPLGIRTEDAIK